VLEPLKAVAQTANSLGFSYFLAGATARDLILESVFGRSPGRLTRDFALKGKLPTIREGVPKVGLLFLLRLRLTGWRYDPFGPHVDR
jgi:hypothetical protein